MLPFAHLCSFGHSSPSRRGLESEGRIRAGVLVPLVPTEEGYDLLFTRRTEEVETHKGQISFPGGMLESEDRNIVATALREAYEELGLPIGVIRIAGLLDDMATPTGFVITPVVGIVDPLPPLVVNPTEVAEVFSVPLSFFADPANGRVEFRTIEGPTREVWFYEANGHVIWGATAAITRMLLRKIAPPQDGTRRRT